MNRPVNTSASPAARSNQIARRHARRIALLALSVTALASLFIFDGGSAAQTGTCSPGQELDYTVTQTTGAAITPGTVAAGSQCDDCTTQITLPFPVTIYDQTFTTVRASSNGNLQFATNRTFFSNTNLPHPSFNTTIYALWDDLSLFLTGNGIFTSVTGTAPNRTFNIEWRARHASTGGTVNFEVQLIEGSPNFNIIYGNFTGTFNATIGAQRDTGSRSTQFAGPNANPPAPGTKLAFTYGCTTPPPTLNYQATQTSGVTLTPGTVDTGNHCDDCTTNLTLPFPVTIYDETFTGTVRVNSNGTLQFGTVNQAHDNTNLPNSGFGTTIFPLWDDLRTDGAGNGIFTSVTGAAPNRIFNIEWRATHFETGGAVNFEIQLFEGSSAFNVIYGNSTGAFSGTIGVQGNTRHRSTQFAGPFANPPAPGTRLAFTASVVTPTPTPTPTPAPTPAPCQPGTVSTYTVAQTTGGFSKGFLNSISDCDDCTRAITLPFPVTIYDQTFTGTVRASSNGNLQFVGNNAAHINTNLPNSGFDTTIFPFWDDLRTDFGDGGNGGLGGIFTSVTGTAPQRRFNILWKTDHYLTGGGVSFELQLFENSTTFHIVYGNSLPELSGTIGVQRDTGSRFTQFAGPDADSPAPGTKLVFTTTCVTPQPTPTPTPTPTRRRPSLRRDALPAPGAQRRVLPRHLLRRRRETRARGVLRLRRRLRRGAASRTESSWWRARWIGVLHWRATLPRGSSTPLSARAGW